METQQNLMLKLKEVEENQVKYLSDRDGFCTICKNQIFRLYL